MRSCHLQAIKTLLHASDQIRGRTIRERIVVLFTGKQKERKGENMKNPIKSVIMGGVGTLVGVGMAGPIANASESAALTPGMGTGGAALIRTTPMIYSGGVTLGSLGHAKKFWKI